MNRSDIGTLVLSRREDEVINIGDDISITVVRIEPQKVKLVIKAPKTIQITRSELLARMPNELQETLAAVRAQQ